MTVGLCRWLLCRSALGNEYRLLYGGTLHKTLMCREHEDLLDQVFDDRRAGRPTPPIVVSGEGWVYADVWDAIIRRTP